MNTHDNFLFRFLCLIGSLLITADLRAEDLDKAPIHYGTAATDNAITRLTVELKSQKAQLQHDDEHGYLRSLLKTLKVPVSSQVLVFSKTSLQRHRINPKTPRAIYFNDDVTVGFCHQGDVIEVAASDAQLGTVFYTLNQKQDDQPRFARQTEMCLTCHGSSSNQGFPGHLNRSVSSDSRGELVLSRGTKRVDHSTALTDRWGGWYVTGRAGKQTHMGNQIVGGWNWAAPEKQPDHANVTSLKEYFTVANYLTPHSDLIALMVLEHQGEALNRIGRANMLTRIALHDQEELNKSFHEPATQRSEGTIRRIRVACEPVVQYLLFSGEAKLSEEISGTSEFAKEFVERGPFDSQKRTLRQFDLKKRLFKYPLSFTIYTKQFDGLHEDAKTQIYQRLWEVLSGQDRSKEFEHLTQMDKQTILEILRETKPGLPDYWNK